MAIPCPLCCQSISIDLLRANLIGILNRPLICPMCGDVQHSLDNLAAHLTQHFEPVPSQIDHHYQPSMPCVTSNSIDANAMNTAVNNSAIYSGTSAIEQFKVEQNSDGNLTGKFDVPSPLSPSSPPVSLQSLNIASEAACAMPTIIDQPFVCNLCDVKFRSKELQQMHMRLVHGIDIRPSREKKLLKNAGANSPAANPMQQCYWCPKRFKTIGSLRLHVRMVHGALHVPQIVCSPNAFNCKTTMSGNNLVPLSPPSSSTISPSMVEAVARGNDKIELKIETGDAPIASTSTSTGNLPLIHNNQTDYYSNYGVNDTTFDGNGDCVSDGSMIDQKDIDVQTNNGNNNNSKEMPITSADDRIHKCDICNKRFTTKYFLKKHKRLHTGEMPYSCELCHRTFTFQQSYHRHLSYHTNDRPHSCTICGRAFKELSTLHNHQRIHSGEKPFECETCGKCFRQRVSYLVHQRIHTGVMPYECMTCETKFRYKISLRTHKCARYMGNERTAAATTTTTAATIKTETTTTTTASTTVNDDDAVTFMDNDHQSMSMCHEQQPQQQHQQSLDELITESCNRMGIGDQIDSNHSDALHCAIGNDFTHENGGDAVAAANQSMLQFDCDSFNLNDLAFCTAGESNSTDLANVIPSMNEIFPQTLEILNALYDNASANNSDLQTFYSNNNNDGSIPHPVHEPVPIPTPSPPSAHQQ